jgi:rhodanese-related sulfurtransferase
MFGFLRPTQSAPLADIVNRVALGEMTLVDVRDHSEVAMGKAAGAVHVPLMRLQDMATPSHPDCHAAFKSGKPIALYCASGARSGMAARILAQLGYEDVTNIGGLGHWAQAGGAIER